MQTPSLMCPLSILIFGKHIRSITGPIYVSVPFCAANDVRFRGVAGPKDEEGIEGFESAFKELGSCVPAAPFFFAASDVRFTASFWTLVLNLQLLASGLPPHT